MASRNVGHLLPKLLRATDRQRSLYKIASFQSSLCQQNVPVTQFGCRYLSSAVAAAEEEVSEDGWRKSKVRSNEEEVIDKLLYSMDLAIRRRGRVMKFDLEKIFNLIEKTRVCSSNQALLIIKCCGEVLVDLDRKSRSEITERCIRLIKGLNDTPLDISHYNALLKVYLENDHKVNVSEFLSELEQNDLAANRVTYQHCVSLYCQQGDIGGATAILQHMKKQDLAINEAVFHSLLAAHCLNFDPDSVSSTLEVMTNSGLNIGADAYTIMAASYGKAGQWEMVTQTLDKAADENVKLTDADYLTVIQACSDSGLTQSNVLIEKLPKQRGFFQEVRNIVPQLALSGNIDAAIELYTTLKNRDNFDKEGQGMFIVSSIARSGADVDSILEAINKLEEDGFSTAMQFLLQEVAFNWSEEDCQKLSEALKKSEKKVEISADQLYKYVRGASMQHENVDILLKCLKNLRSMDVKIPEPMMGSDIIPKVWNPNDQPIVAVNRIEQALPNFSRSYISNGMLLHLLNSETAQNFDEAVGFMLNIGMNLKSDKWNSSLARAYLNTNDVDNFVTILSVTALDALEREQVERKLTSTFRSIFHIGKQAHIIQAGVPVDKLVSPIIQQLIDIKVGIPSDLPIFQDILGQLQDEASRSLLEKAGDVWKENKSGWTKENVSELVKKRKSIFNEKMKAKRANSPKLEEIKVDFKSLNSKQELEAAQATLSNAGRVSNVVADRLISIYATEGDFQKAFSLKDYCQTKSPFILSPSTFEDLIEAFIKQNKSLEARDLIKKEIVDKEESQQQMFGSGLMKCLAALASDGDHKAVMELLEKIDKKKLINQAAWTNKFLAAYANKGEVEQLHEAFMFLVANDFISTDNADNLVALIDVHLTRDDSRSAVAEFCRISKLYHKLPKKFYLTCKLIEEDDVDAVQEIMDASSSVIGEEKSIYDLGHAFLSMGRKGQAKKLFETPGLRCYDDRISYIYDQFSKGSKTDHSKCEDLVAVTKSIFNCNRDILYLKLVDTLSSKPEKMEDIWLQIQEEGHIPSNNLLRSLAKVLEDNGKPVPFVVPPEDEKSGKLKENDVLVRGAIKIRDFSKVVQVIMDSFKDDSTSLTCKRQAIEFLVRQKETNKAAMIARELSKHFEDPKKIHFRRLYYEIIEDLGEKKGKQFLNSLHKPIRDYLIERGTSGQLDTIESLAKLGNLDEAEEKALKICEGDIARNLNDNVHGICELFKQWEAQGSISNMRNFVDTIGPNCNKKLKADIWFKQMLVNVGPEAFVDLVKNDPEAVLNRFMIRTPDLIKIVTKEPTIKTDLISLSNEGNRAATTLVAKLSLHEEDSDMFLRQFEKLSTIEKPQLLFDQVDTMKKLDIALNIAGTEKNYLNVIFKNCFYHHKKTDKFEEICSIARERGLEELIPKSKDSES